MLESVLQEGLQRMGIAADDSTLRSFRIYYERLTEANRVMNLTAISGEDETARLHFLDSAAPLLLSLPEHGSVIDVGTGAGFPGLPIKLLRPSLSLTLLDSLGKRVRFLEELCRELELQDVKCLHGRAEECGQRRETYDIAVSRAVARLNLLCELCLPYVRPGGMFLALKGPAAAEELAEAERAISLLGGKAEPLFSYQLPGDTLDHRLVIIRKVSPTPQKYPRKFATIKKSPL